MNHLLPQIFPDNACRREIINLDVHCTFHCQWTGKLKELDVSGYVNTHTFPFSVEFVSVITIFPVQLVLGSYLIMYLQCISVFNDTCT